MFAGPKHSPAKIISVLLIIGIISISFHSQLLDRTSRNSSFFTVEAYLSTPFLTTSSRSNRNHRHIRSNHVSLSDDEIRHRNHRKVSLITIHVAKDTVFNDISPTGTGETSTKTTTTTTNLKKTEDYQNDKNTKKGTNTAAKHHTRRNSKNEFISRNRQRDNFDFTNITIKNKRDVKAMFKRAKDLERTGQWQQATVLLNKILEIDPYDSYSHLALGRLQSRREKTLSLNFMSSTIDNDHENKKIIETEIAPSIIAHENSISKATQTFYNGIINCPNSVHLYHAWGLHEQSLGNLNFARSLFQAALQMDTDNPYVCHAYGLLEQRCGNIDLAIQLWNRPLLRSIDGSSISTENTTNQHSMNYTTAALVCSLGKLLVSQNKHQDARELYMNHVLLIRNEREKSEVYLAAAWLEEKYFKKVDRAEELLNLVLEVSPGNSRALVALARLAGRRVDHGNKFHNFSSITNMNNDGDDDDDGDDNDESYDTLGLLEKEDGTAQRNAVIKQRLKEACDSLTLEMKQHKRKMKYRPSDVKDGRLFNALADLEAQDGRLGTARNTLLKGMKLFPRDQSAAGRVEEKVGNFTGARDWYSASLSIEPSAPTLVAYAMLELRHPEGNLTNYTKVCRLFEEALLLDPRHGPVYNAYGNMELKRGNVEKSRNIYQNGVNAHCTDVASVYHGLAKVELATGNVEEAKSVLRQGLKQVEYDDGMMDSNQKKRALFLAHTLGFLELRTHRIAEAKNVFQSGIERNGPSSQLLLGAALCEVKLNRIDLARKLFEQAVNVDRGHAQAWQMWGVMEMRAGNYKVAKMLFECGLKNDPSHGALWQAYATLESRRGKTNVSRTLFAKGILKCPKHVPLYQAWACLEMRNENYDKAKVLISEALTRNKKAGSGWVVAAKIEENLGNRPLMALILRRGLEYDPYCYQLYIALADYEFQRGRVQAARDILEKALEIDPTQAILYHSLAELEAKVFNIEGLSKLNKRTAEIFQANKMVPIPQQPFNIRGLNTLLRKSLSSSSTSQEHLKTVATLAELVGLELQNDKGVGYTFDSDFDPDDIIEQLSQDDNEDDIFDI